MKTKRRCSVVAGLLAGSSWLQWAQAQTTSVTSGLQLTNTGNVIDAARAQAALEPITEKTIPVFTFDSSSPPGTYWLLQSDSPPLPYDPFPELMVYALGGDAWLVDDRSVDYPGLQAQWLEQAQAAGLLLSPHGGGVTTMDSGVPSPPGDDEGGGEGGTNDPPSTNFVAALYTTNDLWLEIAGFTNHAASLLIHRPWNETNVTHDLFYTTNLSPPVTWRLLTRCISNNVVVPDLCDAQGFFRLGRTNGSLTVTTNATPCNWRNCWCRPGSPSAMRRIPERISREAPSPVATGAGYQSKPA